MLKALEKLDQRATERQGARELRTFLDDKGGASLGSLVPALLKNLRQKVGVFASSECVLILAECFESEPAACAPLLPKMVAAIVAQMGRGDARQREACAAALGRVAAATAACPPVEGGPAFGPVANQRLAVLLSPLLTSLVDPNACLQEGASVAVMAVLAKAHSSDVAESMPVLLPRLARATTASLAPHASFLALAAALRMASGELVAAAAPQAVASIVKALGAAEHRTRTSAARAAVPLLTALRVDPSEDSADGGPADPNVEPTVALLREALDRAKYDRVASVRTAVGEASALLPKRSDMLRPIGAAADEGTHVLAPASRGPRPVANRTAPRPFARHRPTPADGSGSVDVAILVLEPPHSSAQGSAEVRLAEAPAADIQPPVLNLPASPNVEIVARPKSETAAAEDQHSPLLIAPSPLERAPPLARAGRAAPSPLEPLRQSSENLAWRQSGGEPRRAGGKDKAPRPQDDLEAAVASPHAAAGAGYDTASPAPATSPPMPSQLAPPLRPSPVQAGARVAVPPPHLLADEPTSGRALPAAAALRPAPVGHAATAGPHLLELPAAEGESQLALAVAEGQAPDEPSERDETKENVSPSGGRAAGVWRELTPSLEPRVLAVLAEDPEAASAFLEPEEDDEDDGDYREEYLRFDGGLLHRPTAAHSDEPDQLEAHSVPEHAAAMTGTGDAPGTAPDVVTLLSCGSAGLPQAEDAAGGGLPPRAQLAGADAGSRHQEQPPTATERASVAPRPEAPAGGRAAVAKRAFTSSQGCVYRQSSQSCMVGIPPAEAQANPAGRPAPVRCPSDSSILSDSTRSSASGWAACALSGDTGGSALSRLSSLASLSPTLHSRPACLGEVARLGPLGAEAPPPAQACTRQGAEASVLGQRAAALTNPHDDFCIYEDPPTPRTPVSTLRARLERADRENNSLRAALALERERTLALERRLAESCGAPLGGAAAVPP